MIVFRCDVCKRDQPTVDSLKTGALNVTLGKSLVANLPTVDRCARCYENFSGALRSMIQGLDDTQHRIVGEALDEGPNGGQGIDLATELDRAEQGRQIPWPNDGAK